MKGFAVEGIHHLGIVPKDLPKAIWFFKEVLGLPFLAEEKVEEQKSNTYMFESKLSSLPPIHSRFELLEPTTESGPIYDYLQTRKGGIHHIAIAVSDINKAIAYLLSNGVKMVDSVPRNGSHHTRIAFVHPSSTGGILVELVASSPS